MSEFLLSTGRTRRLASFGHALATLALWHERSRQRRQLGQLDSHLLADIGIDRRTRDREAAKPFWQA